MSKSIQPRIFISHARKDNAWVSNVMIPALGIDRDSIVTLDQFTPGAPLIEEFERAITSCRYIILVLSHDWLQDVWSNFGSLLATFSSSEARKDNLIPVLLSDCPVPLHLRYRVLLDCTVPASWNEVLARLRGHLRSMEEVLSSPAIAIAPYIQLPYMRNRFFTGREQELERLHDTLSSDRKVAVTAIHGLGGIGKTQTALEYAYRKQEHYKRIFWVRADNESSLKNGFLEIARQLHLPEQNSHDPGATVNAVKWWLGSNKEWLLILDNAEAADVIQSFMPLQPGGYVLITSRSSDFQALGVLRPFELKEMSAAEAREFFERRLDFEGTDPADRESELKAAEQLAELLGYLPLAMEQAAAFIVANSSRVQDYHARYCEDRLHLLDQLRPSLGNYPESVATTWLLNFSQIEQQSATASDLLKVSAFLHPDNIPFELISQGAADLGPELSASFGPASDPIQIDILIRPLRSYSLISKNKNSRTYSIHRLVQEATRARLSPDSRRLWIERAAAALGRVFPEVEHGTFRECARLISHAKTIVHWASEIGLETAPLAAFLLRVSRYLQLRAEYADAADHAQRGLAMSERLSGVHSPEVAAAQHLLGNVYEAQGRFADAERLVRQSLVNRELCLGPCHADVANSLNDLGEILVSLSRHAEAEPCYRRALQIRETVLGADHVDCAMVLNNLAFVYFYFYGDGESLRQAEDMLRRAIAAYGNPAKVESPQLAKILNSLALLYSKFGKYAESESLYNRAIAIREKTLGRDHPYVGLVVNNLALLYKRLEKYEDAMRLIERARSAFERSLGSEHPYVARSLLDLGKLHLRLGRLEEAESCMQRCVEIHEKAFKGGDHYVYATSIHQLAEVYASQQRFVEAEQWYLRAIAMRENTLGARHPHLATSQHGLGVLYRKHGQYQLAEDYLLRALTLREQTLTALTEHHPDLIESLWETAQLFLNTNRRSAARPYLERALHIAQQSLLDQHPMLLGIRDQLAQLDD